MQSANKYLQKIAGWGQVVPSPAKFKASTNAEGTGMRAQEGADANRDLLDNTAAKAVENTSMKMKTFKPKKLDLEEPTQ